MKKILCALFLTLLLSSCCKGEYEMINRNL